MASRSLRTVVASLLSAVAIAIAWSRLESSGSPELLAVVVLGLAPALAPFRALKATLGVVSFAAAGWIALGVKPWELLPYRDERVVVPLLEAFGRGIGDYYDVIVPFDPSRRPEMHGVLLIAVLVFVLAIALLVAARKPLAAAAVTIAGVGWPATLVDAAAVGIGTLALAGALAIPLVLRSRSPRALAGGIAIAALVVGGAASVSAATSFTREAVVDWQMWNVRGPAPRAAGVRFIWDAQYDGIQFPSTATEVLRIKGPKRAQYWRASTLNSFYADRWGEDLSFVLTSGSGGRLTVDALVPRVARDEDSWTEQEIEVRALVDNRLVAAGIPMSVDARLGTLFAYEGGTVQAQRALTRGSRYRMWSYLPDPAATALARAPARYPAATTKYLTLWGQELPAYGEPRRARRVGSLLSDPSYSDFGAYRPLYERARRVTQGTKSPYAAVLALESWFRSGGGFRYDEQPPRSSLPPLIGFVTESRAGYCQHFAGAMAVMTRLLGIPSRVAVGFTSGKLVNGAWSVSDLNAHAWVEVWFPEHGWVPFDPTPGRGTFSTSYSVASNSPATVEALERGSLSEVPRAEERADQIEGGTVPGPGAEAPSRPSILTIALVLSALSVAAIGLLKWLRRRVAYLTFDPRRIAAASRNELVWFLRDQGITVPRGATLDTLRRAVGEELGFDAGPFVSAAGRARFGTPADTRLAATRARQELKSLLSAVRSELSVAARARGFISLRSLHSEQN